MTALQRELLQSETVPRTVIDRMGEVIQTIDDNYGAERSCFDYGGYILYFPNEQTYRENIARWKLEIQLTKMLKQIWRSPETTISNLVGNIEQNYVEYQERSEDKEVARLEREKERKEQRMKNLLEMRLDGEIDKARYLLEKESLEKRIDEINTALKGLLGNEPEPLEEKENLEYILSQIYHTLEETADLEKKFLDEELVDKVVERVVPYEGSLFKWYLNIGSEPEGDFNESDFVKYTEFVIGFDEARAYRKQFGNFMRMCQWNDITIEVYIRV